MSNALYKKWVPVLFLSLGIGSVLNAQYVVNYRRAGDQFYAKGDYYSAAQYYEKYLEGKAPAGQPYDPYIIQKQGAGNQAVTKNEKELQELEYKLAESYRLVNDYAHAAPWYKKVLNATYPLAHYRYAVCLRTEGQYSEAQPELELFLKQYRQKDAVRKEAEQELADIVFIQQELNKPAGNTIVIKLSNTINKEGASYAAGWLDAGTLIFTSTRSAGTGKVAYTNALYQASLQSDSFGEAAQLPVPVLKDKEQGVATVTPDGKKIFFTAWSMNKDGKKQAGIYASEKTDKGWTAPVILDNNVNSDGADTRQPQVTADGNYLLFASNRPGGKGGFDIWYAPLTNGVPGKAVNAGAVINTSSDEQAPFYHAGTNTLVFASNGRTGMGGFDLYTAAGSLGGDWAEPQNMGYPVNSVKDDIYFVSRGKGLLEEAWMSSDRASACCLELFSVHLKPVEVVVAPPPPPVDTTTKKPGIFEGKKTLVTHNIGFAFRKKDLTAESFMYLDEVAAYLKDNPQSTLEIDAHTDGIGSAEFNLHLSQQRAEACVAYLVKAGIARERLIAKGLGESAPLEKEKTGTGRDIPAAREKNRRVELKLIDK